MSGWRWVWAALACAGGREGGRVAPVSDAWAVAYGAVVALEPTISPLALDESCAAGTCRYRVPLPEAVPEDGLAAELSELADPSPWHVREVRVTLAPDGAATLAFSLVLDGP